MTRLMNTVFGVVTSVFVLQACSADADPQTNAEAVKQASDSGQTLDGVVNIRDFIGRVTIETGAGLKYDAVLIPGKVVDEGKLESPDIEISANGITVQGENDVSLKQCRKSDDGKYKLELKGDVLRPLDDFPTLEITMPNTASLDLELHSGIAEIGDVNSTSVAVNGCGDVFLQDVTNHFVGTINGSGDIEAEDLGNAAININGSGDVMVANVGGKAVLEVRGSGDIELDDITGAFYASIKGSGDISAESANDTAIIQVYGSGDIGVGGGRFSTVDIGIKGSGDVDLDAEIDQMNIHIAGSGDVSVDKLNGTLTGRLDGSGDLSVDGENIVYKNGRWIR